jgi:hypothetical protein
VTYPLHIILRFEIERGLIEGTLDVDDVPAAWDAKMEEYLGAKPADAAQGCLQDVHWSAGGRAACPVNARAARGTCVPCALFCLLLLGVRQRVPCCWSLPCAAPRPPSPASSLLGC